MIRNNYIDNSGQHMPFADFSTSGVGVGIWDTSASPVGESSFSWQTTVVVRYGLPIGRVSRNDVDAEGLLDGILETYSEAWETLAKL